MPTQHWTLLSNTPLPDRRGNSVSVTHRRVALEYRQNAATSREYHTDAVFWAEHVLGQEVSDVDFKPIEGQSPESHSQASQLPKPPSR